LQIDTEIMEVTGVSGTTFTVARGVEGTTAAGHTTGATVTAPVTARALNNLIHGVNVLSYGAKGDGSTDDTSALHAARDAAGTWGTVYVPPGTYRFSGLSLNVQGQNWILARGAILKQKNGAISDSSISAADVVMEGGEWDGNRSAVSAAGSGLWMTSAAVRSQVRNMRIHNTLNRCIETNADYTVVADCEIYDSDGPGIVAQTNCDFIQITGNYVHDFPSGIPIAVKGETPNFARGVRISDNHVEPANDVQICIEVFGLSQHSIISGNMTYRGSMGVSVDASDWTVVSGNSFRHPDFNGVELAGTRYCTVTGNTTEGGGAGTDNGVSISSPSTSSSFNTITGNTFTGCTRGVKAVAVSDHNLISGNIVKDASFAAVELGASAHGTIVGNTFHNASAGSSVGVIFDNASHGIVQGNDFENFATGVSAGGTSDNLRVIGNRFTGVTTKLSGFGSSNRKAALNDPTTGDQTGFQL
jgi:nitrous oxidase accessory protein NosD